MIRYFLRKNDQMNIMVINTKSVIRENNQIRRLHT